MNWTKSEKDLKAIRLEFEIRCTNIEKTLELMKGHYESRNLARFFEVFELQERCEALEERIKRIEYDNKRRL